MYLKIRQKYFTRIPVAGLGPENVTPSVCSFYLTLQLGDVNYYLLHELWGPESRKHVIHSFPQQIFVGPAVCPARGMALIMLCPSQ